MDLERVKLTSRHMLMSGLSVVVMWAGLATPARGGPANPADVLVAGRPPTIDTTAEWDRKWGLGQFGRIGFATIGQELTGPDEPSALTRFVFYLGSSTESGLVDLRGELYRWNGDRAIGRSIWESDTRTVELRQDQPSFQPLSFAVDGARLKSGQRYVLFISISKDYASCDPDVGGLVGLSTGDDPYGGGTTVALDNKSRPKSWKQQAWRSFAYDLAFKAWFRPDTSSSL